MADVKPDISVITVTLRVGVLASRCAAYEPTKATGSFKLMSIPQPLASQERLADPDWRRNYVQGQADNESQQDFGGKSPASPRCARAEQAVAAMWHFTSSLAPSRSGLPNGGSLMPGMSC